MRWTCKKSIRQLTETLTAKGHPYQEIIWGLAFKWQRIITGCWRSHEPYDEQRYLQRLRDTGSRLIAYLPKELDSVT